MSRIQKYIPTYCAKTIFDIDFDKLYAIGKKIILTDLDNTLISYNDVEADHLLLKLNTHLYQLGFKLYIISNNNDQRIVKFCQSFTINGYLTKANKPKCEKLNNFLTNLEVSKNEVIFIGDQLVTDIACANNTGIDSILVSSIDRSTQKWYTKINRLREKFIINQILEKDYLTGLKIKKTVEGKGEHE